MLELLRPHVPRTLATLASASALALASGCIFVVPATHFDEESPDGGGGGIATQCNVATSPNSDFATCICLALGETARNDIRCSEKAQPGSVCCGTSTWPTAAGTCSCEPWRCKITKDACACGPTTAIADETAPTGCETTSFAFCCKPKNDSGSKCTCSAKACADNETLVDHCGLDNAGCGASERRVSACSELP